ncbi:hypothetical protein NLX83_32530 [Allokutzneria sp. A3M-2-11 16]|uniref:DddA-like double-stranded DNA deaminase toxin n=1 Tax=Allokutzneria sp. A3M-2-11 16 TaxID=2962043 RepID=UPI0020B6CBE5|nr:DddA-like double-stranded DNA deaminase toxin [Allokutzneria sp. A3M-2-11 16]MCP3804007.1 hypothetical protein [Allokutzneria sp. A3M-2-11 16]
MSVQKVVEAAQRVVTMLPCAVLVEAGSLLEESATAWHHATEGGDDAAIEEAHAAYHGAKDHFDTVIHTATILLPDAVNRWITSLTGTTSRTAAFPAPEPTSSRQDHAAASRAVQIDRARRDLPPPVEGARTLGVWIAADAQKVDLSSGKGEYFSATLEFARTRGLAPPKGIWTLARHLELQFAIRLRATYDRDPDTSIVETIAIDRPPCEPRAPGEPSCDTLLPTFLPPGATLTILVQDGTCHTYRGARP